MARFQNNKQRPGQKPFSTECVPLGTLIHPVGDLLVLKLQHKDIPYPNSPVLFSKKQVGRVDDVFGPVDDVYVSVKLDASQQVANFAANANFEAFKEKFIPKAKFLPREEVERNKEKNDKKKDGKPKKPNGNSFQGKKGFQPKGKPKFSPRPKNDKKKFYNGKDKRNS